MFYLISSAFLVLIAAHFVLAAEDCGQEELSEQALGHLIEYESDAATHLLQFSKVNSSKSAVATGLQLNQSGGSFDTEVPTHLQSALAKKNKTQTLVALDLERLKEKGSELKLNALPLHVRNVSHWYFGIHASSGNPLLPQTWKGLFMDCFIFFLVMLPVMIVSFFMRRARANGERRLVDCMFVKTSLHAGFAFINGWVNVIMVVRYGMFATMMVGNTIMMGVSYVCSQHPDMGNSCPKHLRPVPNYLVLIGLFIAGSMLYGFVDKKWNSRHEYLVFGTIFVTACVIDELFISDSYTDLYIYSPLFGCAGAMAVNGGLGGVPWAATGNILKAGYFSSRFISDQNERDGEQGIAQIFIWVAFLFGIVIGCSVESEFALMWNILSLSCLFYLLGIATKEEETSPAAPSTSKQETSAASQAETM